MSEIEGKVVAVTAEQAMEWLGRTEELGFQNRTLRKGLVDKYAQVMSKGKWVLNGEAIIIDKHGALLNGQHRLHAVLETTLNTRRKSIKMFVVEGVERSAFATMDQGRHRSAGDVLSQFGLAQGFRNELPALMRLLAHWEDGRFTGTRPHLDNAEVAKMVAKDYEFYLECCRYGNRVGRDLGRKTVWAFLYWVLKTEVGSEDVDEFLTKLETGENLSAKNPILALRSRAMRLRMDKHRADPRSVINAAVRCWNAFVQNRTLANVQLPKAGDPLPEIEG